jgi:tRNA wybutosine-synthesizing protein 2
MRTIVVPKEKAMDLLRQLHAMHLVDRSLKTAKRDGDVLIPVVADPSFDLLRYGARTIELASLWSRSVSRDPRDTLRERLRAAGVPPEDAPRRWERIGDIVTVRVPPGGRKKAHAIGEIYGQVLSARTVVEVRSGIHGPLRTPEVRILWGDGTETVHVEAGVRYTLDIARVMFSSGNIAERMGIANRIPPEAVVVDLFAGIGYFALPIALRSQAKTVYACELNPVAFRYLVENIRINRAVNVVPLPGDCRAVAPRGIADWVIMGHFDAHQYLDVAFGALRKNGTILYHELCPREQYPDALARRLAASARAQWMSVVSMRTRIVKSYAPGIVHAVAEVRVTPQMRR